EVGNLAGWLTTVVARVCLDMLRSRKIRREDSLELPIHQVRSELASRNDPEQEVAMTDSVGLALLIVLDTLPPAERLAFVLHDVFAMPFDEIAPIVGRTTVAAKKLASRARQRVQGKAAEGHADWTRQRRVVEAFLTASRSGDFKALIAVLDPEVVRRADAAALPAGGPLEVRGAHDVATETLTNTGLAQFARLALVNGNVGLIVALRRQLRLALSLRFEKDQITEIDVIASSDRLRETQIGVLD
ncbi:MAG: sigma factor-like helix-turn-helix DNA-binding protein, partial [Acidobacteriaceae bacterium]